MNIDIFMLAGQLFVGAVWLILAEREHGPGGSRIACTFFIVGAYGWFYSFVSCLISYIKTGVL